MPGSNTGHLPQALMSFPGQLLGVHPPAIHLTLHTVAFSHPDHIDHLVLAEHSGHGHRLLQTLPDPVHLLRYGSSVQLHLHDVGLLLPQGQQAMNDDSDDRAVFLHQGEILFQLLFARFILPLLAVFSEGLLLTLMHSSPVFVESSLALIAKMFSKYGFEAAQTLYGADVSHHAHHDYGRSLDNSDGLHLLSAMHLPQCVGHASFVSQERSEVDGLFGVVFGPAAYPPMVPLAPLVGQEAHMGSKQNPVV
ncbi:hypothetical protein AMEX_G22563 [Astyanax mexicanus]|uniref:Uncharacterized protein n=1 Tax=Astyanax mexicanus TaxID=7994 RepID=A0A8T2L323_ASTMX|nr:hypothetical protein AMEX_G22563 [Astyanax mexicanus]